MSSLDLAVPQTTTISGNDPSNNSDCNTRTVILAVSIPCGVALLITITVVLSCCYIHWDQRKSQHERRTILHGHNTELATIAEGHRNRAREEQDQDIKKNFLDSALEAEKQRCKPDSSEPEDDIEEDTLDNSGPVHGEDDSKENPPEPGHPE